MKEEYKTEKTTDKETVSVLDGFWGAELGLCIAYLYIGCLDLQTGWNNPGDAGGIEGGTIYIIGALVCGGLAWRRRNSKRNAFLFIMFFALLAHATEDCFKWLAKEKGAGWPLTGSILTASCLAMIVWKALSHRKSIACGAACDQKRFDMDNHP